jgi:hypothetical protein
MSRRDFNFSRALEAPFQLMRRPLTLIGWGAVIWLPFLFVIPFLTQFFPLPTGGADVEVWMEQNIAGWLAAQIYSQLASWLQLFLGLLVAAWATRVTLTPRARGFAIGMDELRYGLVLIVLWVAFVVVLIALTLIGVAVGAALWSLGDPARGLGISLYVLAAIVLTIWLALRTCLIAPMSMVTGDFAVAAGWRATGGRVWKLLGLIIIVALLAMVVTLFAYAVIAFLGGAVFFGLGGRIDFGAESPAQVTQDWIPLLAAAAAVLLPVLYLTGLGQVFSVAPLAAAAADLAPRPPEMGDAPPASSLDSL